MNSEPKIISSEDILRKYDESGMTTLLPTFKLVNRPYRNLKRRSEIYFNRKTRRKMVVKIFDELEDGTEEMCVTWLMIDETIYVADR